MNDTLRDLLLSSSEPDFETKLAALRSQMLLAARMAGHDSEQNRTVSAILSDVAERGDAAVAEYTKKFDRVALSPAEFRVRADEMSKAHAALDAELLAALRRAIDNVRAYQMKIFIGGQSQFSDGTGIKYTPIRRVGACVPGAAAPLPSTVIMTVIPAQVAGVKEIAVVSPPRCEGSIHPVILAVCHELGVEEVYRIGGVQAVGALACGTQSIPKVDQIVGPGNSWVQAAKKNVAGDYVGIDAIAGPSEVFIVANDQANPTWIAADMLSQAEHAADSGAIVATDSEDLAKSILEHLQTQLGELPRAADAGESLRRFSRVIAVDTLDEAIGLADEQQCRRDLHRPPYAGRCRGLLGRPQPHAAHRDAHEVLQRVDQQRFRQIDQPHRVRRRATRGRGRRHHPPGRDRRPRRPRPQRQDPPAIVARRHLSS
jgi:histidinol dehydrogenase